ncbi:MAG TPA: NAD-dependent epimerase/dehydratase family protein [Stellaceae bacterium]|jgi:GDP-L-fucose synthase|nr:NAD-dependent epimerase/dehydratase family protein [Stellaceae bacterium]
MRVLLTGATGFLGRHTRPVLERRYGPENVVSVSSRDADLMDRNAVDRLLRDAKPDTIVHYATYSGGIGANKAYPADFYYRNTILTAHLFDAASRHGVRKLVYPIGGCSYPAAATSPIDEAQLWCGYPQAESAGYSTAKMMGTVAAHSYRTQYGLDATVVVPGNMYGEYDNFDRLNSHVVPAMIRRYHEAMLAGAGQVVMWGSGRPQRDFVHAGDVAATIPFFIEDFPEPGPVNIASGVAVSIRELAMTIAGHVGFTGDIVWDTTKPDGQMVKIFAVERLHALGLSCPTPLHDGLAATIGWFARNYADRGDGLRL